MVVTEPVNGTPYYEEPTGLQIAQSNNQCRERSVLEQKSGNKQSRY